MGYAEVFTGRQNTLLSHEKRYADLLKEAVWVVEILRLGIKQCYQKCYGASMKRTPCG